MGVIIYKLHLMWCTFYETIHNKGLKDLLNEDEYYKSLSREVVDYCIIKISVIGLFLKHIAHHLAMKMR